MNASDFLPSEPAIEQIRRDLAAYEERRKAAHAAVRWRVPAIMGGFALAALTAAFSLRNLLFDNDYFYLAVAIFGALVFGGIGALQFRQTPSDRVAGVVPLTTVPLHFRLHRQPAALARVAAGLHRPSAESRYRQL